MTYQHKDFGGYLRFLRESNSYTQEYLASLLGFDSYSSYGKYEKGQSKLHVDQAMKLAELYGIEIQDFLNMGKSSGDSVQEDTAMYRKKEKVSIVLELDGQVGSLNRHIEMITRINQAITA